MPAAPERKPQINFQVDPALKALYEEAKISGHWVARFCAAGLLMMVEDPDIRMKSLNRLRDWEIEYADASDEQIRRFVQGAQRAMRSGARGSRPTRSTPAGKKRARRDESA